METNQTNEQNVETKEKKGNRKKIFLIIGAVVVVGVALFFFLRGNYESTDNAQIDADIVPIKAAVAGYVKEIRFVDNQSVKKGDTLLLIDDTDLKARVAQAEAALENAKSNLTSMQGNARATSQSSQAANFGAVSSEQNIAAAKARLTQAQEDFKRTQNLFNAKAATAQQLDAARASLDVAQAQYAAAVSSSRSSSASSAGVRSQAEAGQAMVSLSQALVRQREAELVLARTQLSYASVLAPSDGIVSRRSVEVGQYITVAAPLCSVIDNVHIWITANFKETQINDMKAGQLVDISIDAYPKFELKGKVSSFIGATGAKFALLPPDNSTGNFVKIIQRVPVRIDFSNLTEKERSVLLPGLSAFVKIHLD